MSLDIHKDRPIGATLAEGKVVDGEHPGRWTRCYREGANLAKQRLPADRTAPCWRSRATRTPPSATATWMNQAASRVVRRAYATATAGRRSVKMRCSQLTVVYQGVPHFVITKSVQEPPKGIFKLSDPLFTCLGR